VVGRRKLQSWSGSDPKAVVQVLRLNGVFNMPRVPIVWMERRASRRFIPDLAPLYDLRVWIESDTETTLAASFERGTRLRLKTEFAADSPREGDGFELSVPRCDLNAAGLTRAPGPTRAERRNCRLINASELTAAARDAVKSE
jgi:hypothetical protein